MDGGILLRRLRACLCGALLAAWLPAVAGTHGDGPASPELSDRIESDVRQILARHGLPLAEQGDNPWFAVRPVLSFVGVGEVSYLLYLDRMDEVPLAARAEIVEYCMRLHESMGRGEYIRLQMRATPRQRTLFPPQPDFELVLSDVR